MGGRKRVVTIQCASCLDYFPRTCLFRKIVWRDIVDGPLVLIGRGPQYFCFSCKETFEFEND